MHGARASALQEYLVDKGKIKGKRDVIALEGITFAMDNIFANFQLLSKSSQITQPLHSCAFGIIFKRRSTEVIQAWP